MTDMTDDQEIPGQETYLDTDAPYGRKADGTPKAKPGRRPSATAGAVPPPKRSAPKGSTRTSAAKKSVQVGGTDYREGLGGLLQLAVMPLMVAGKQSQSPALMADAAALALGGPALIEAFNDLAQEVPQVANVLDRVLAVGPYGALLVAVSTIGVQIAVNHGALPAGLMGTKDPAVLAVQLAQQVAERQAAEEAWLADMAAA